MYSLWSMVCLHPVEVLFRPRMLTSAMSSLAASEKMQCGAPTTGSPSVEGLSSSLQQQSSGLLKTILQNVATMLGYEQLKKEHEERIIEFVKGRDVFISLSTGFGKSLC